MDKMKWFEIAYIRDFITFSMYGIENNQTRLLSSTDIEGLTYLARHSVYYQITSETLFLDFEGYLIEVGKRERSCTLEQPKI